MTKYVASIDQGTASSRCLVFDESARIVSVAQKEHRHVYPRPGWVEHDPKEIWENVLTVVREALAGADLSVDDLVALGIANQRETTVLWNRDSGEPVSNAITWQDTRTDHLCRELAGDVGQHRFQERCGLPLATYFSGPKIRWLLDRVPGLEERAEAGQVLFGTMDSWLIWKLTGRHVTDVTNASRTMLMSLDQADWDDDLLDAMGIPRAMLPEIRLFGRVLRRGGRAARGGAGRVRPRRPARGALRPDLLLARRGQVHLRHGQLPAAEHGRAAGALRERPADDGRLQARRRAGHLRARGLDGGDRRARAVVPRQPRS